MILLIKILYMLMTNPGDTVVPFSDAQVVMNQTGLIDEEDKEVLRFDRVFPLGKYQHILQAGNPDFTSSIKRGIEE